MKKILSALLIAGTFISCTKSQFTPNPVSPGSANFTNYISVGNSLTQGYMDDGLYQYGQSNSWPSILAKQMKLADPSMNAFLQPMTTGNGSGHMFLAYVNGSIDPIQPADSSYINPDGPDPSWNTWGSQYINTPMNNMGISGIRLTDCVALNWTNEEANWVTCYFALGSVVNGAGFSRFMNFGPAASPVQYIDNVRASKATFFTCWLGDNDVLGYALNGGVPTIVPLVNDTLDQITPPGVFAQKYDSILLAFHNLGAKGMCVTIPNVTSIPYFNTVPTYVLVDGIRKYFWITTGTGVVRQATDNDFILLGAYDSVQAGAGTSAARALANDLVLDTAEASLVEKTTLQYNASIKSLAAQYHFGVVDMYLFLENLQSSMTIDGITFTRTFISGGTFGLDGIHPNARGYAVVANQMIMGINNTYGSTLPLVDVTKYKGEIFPNF
ncbi:MAG: SGNH/GDSL hydrolase family protein [Bacteroidia bacterium]